MSLLTKSDKKYAWTMSFLKDNGYQLVVLEKSGNWWKEKRYVKAQKEL